jgi:hypothetical protein
VSQGGSEQENDHPLGPGPTSLGVKTGTFWPFRHEKRQSSTRTVSISGTNTKNPKAFCLRKSKTETAPPVMSTKPAFDDAGSSNHHDQSDRSEPEAIARQVLLAVNETRAVNGLRYAVAFVLSLAAILVSGGLYLYMTRDQSNDFENQFTGYAARIVDHLEVMLERKLAALEALSASYTAHALSGGGPFPNVTLPYAEVRGAETRILADALFCQYFVLVTDEQRAGWEAYAATQQGWMDEAFAREVDHRMRQDARFGYNSTTSSRRELMTTTNVVHQQQQRDLQMGYMPKIYDLSQQARPEGSGPYMVYWQNSPVMPLKAVLNFDMMSHPISVPFYSN